MQCRRMLSMAGIKAGKRETDGNDKACPARRSQMACQNEDSQRPEKPKQKPINAKAELSSPHDRAHEHLKRRCGTRLRIRNIRRSTTRPWVPQYQAARTRMVCDECECRSKVGVGIPQGRPFSVDQIEVQHDKNKEQKQRRNSPGRYMAFGLVAIHGRRSTREPL